MVATSLVYRAIKCYSTWTVGARAGTNDATTSEYYINGQAPELSNIPDFRTGSLSGLRDTSTGLEWSLICTGMRKCQEGDLII